MEELMLIRENLTYPTFSDPLKRRMLKILLESPDPGIMGKLIGVK